MHLDVTAADSPFHLAVVFDPRKNGRLALLQVIALECAVASVATNGGDRGMVNW